MDTIIFKLMFCLSLASAGFTPENRQWSSQSPVTVQQVTNTTKGTSMNSSEQSTSTLTTAAPDTTLTSAAADNTSTTFTNSGHTQTVESTGATKPSNSTSERTDATATQTETHSESHTHESTTTTTAAAITTAKSSVVTATSKSVLSTQGARLSISERNLTITFSVVLALFALAAVALKSYKWRYQLQFLHEPLLNTQDQTASTAKHDALVISGGLSDGHPIYDNVPPPAGHDEAQFSLEFLH